MSTDHTHKTLAQAVTGHHDGHSSQTTHGTGVHTETHEAHGVHPVGAHGVHTETHGAHGLTGAHTTGVHTTQHTETHTQGVHGLTGAHTTGVHTTQHTHLTGTPEVHVEKIVNAPVIIEHHHEHVKTVIHPSIERQHETVEVRQVIQPVHEKIDAGSHDEYAGKHVKVVEKVESAHAAEQQIAANHAKLAAQAQVTTSKSESVVVDKTKEKDVAAHHKVIEQVTPVIYRDVDHEKVIHKDEQIVEKIAHAPEVHVVNQTHTTTHVEGGDHTHKHVTVDHDHKHVSGDHSHGHKHADHTHGHTHGHDHNHASGDHSHGHTHSHDHKHADHKH